MKFNHTKKVIFGIAAINILILGTFFYWFIFQRNPAWDMDLRCNTKVLEKNLVGRSLPDYEFVNLDGKDIYPDLMNGKVLIVVFLTDCQACLAEFDFLESHFSQLSSELKIVAITSESKEIVKQFVDEHKTSFPVYLDSQGGLMLKERVACTPTLFFLENGIVQKIKIGKTNNYKDLAEVF